MPDTDESGGALPIEGPEHADVRHERSDVNVRVVVIFALGLVVVGVLVQLLMWLLFDYFAAREDSKDPAVRPLAAVERQQPPEPRLQAQTSPETAYGFAAAPSQNLDEFRAAEDAVLRSYGWVDRQAGAVRIPIERAMELVVERGLPPTSSTVSPAPPASPGPGGPTVPNKVQP